MICSSLLIIFPSRVVGLSLQLVEWFLIVVAQLIMNLTLESYQPYVLTTW